LLNEAVDILGAISSVNDFESKGSVEAAGVVAGVGAGCCGGELGTWTGVLMDISFH
jgi:hypothetical protein